MIELCHGELDTLIVSTSVPDSTQLKYSIPDAGHRPAGTNCVFYSWLEQLQTVKKPKIRKGAKAPRSTSATKSIKMAKKDPNLEEGRQSLFIIFIWQILKTYFRLATQMSDAKHWHHLAS